MKGGGRMDKMPELATIERLLKERDAKMDMIELLESGNIDKVIKMLKRDVETINESLKTK